MTQAEKQKMFLGTFQTDLFSFVKTAKCGSSEGGSVMCCSNSWKGMKIKAKWKQEKQSTQTKSQCRLGEIRIQKTDGWQF